MPGNSRSRHVRKTPVLSRRQFLRLAAMRRLTHDRDGDGKTDLWGGMAEPPAMQALEWIRERMWTDHVMPTFLDVQKMGTRDAFMAGRAGKPAQIVVAL